MGIGFAMREETEAEKVYFPKVMNGSQLKLRDLSRLVEDRGGPLANVEHGSKPFEPREKS